MEISNKDLAKNRSFPVAVTQMQCSICNHVSNDRNLCKIGTSCPNCGDKDEPRKIFPDTAAIELLKMISYFYNKACEREEDAPKELLNELLRLTERKFEHEEMEKIASEVSRLSEEKMSEVGYLEIMITHLKRIFPSESREKLRKILWLLTEYKRPKNQLYEEYKAVIILTCTLLEKLFQDFLLELILKNGIERDKATRQLDNNRGMYNREKIFKKNTNKSFEDALKDLSLSDFYVSWKKVRETRNDLVHGKYNGIYRANKDVAELAFNLAKSSFSVFAALTNAYCIKDFS